MQITLSSEGLWNMLQSLNPDAKRLADVKAGRTISSEEAHRQMKEYIASL